MSDHLQHDDVDGGRLRAQVIEHGVDMIESGWLDARSRDFVNSMLRYSRAPSPFRMSPRQLHWWLSLLDMVARKRQKFAEDLREFYAEMAAAERTAARAAAARPRAAAVVLDFHASESAPAPRPREPADVVRFDSRRRFDPSGPRAA